MLYYGMNITQSGDPLYGIDIDVLHKRLLAPKPAITDLITRLRILQIVDPARYAQLKKSLPYLVCGCFTPAVRRRENFVSIRHFFLDLDHIAAHHDMASLRERLCADEQIVLLFTSPGGDGLKLLFNLDQPCHDAGLYGTFYKLFVTGFAARHGLQDVIDQVTSDVSRACFISADENAWYRPGALPVRLETYVEEAGADAAIDAARQSVLEMSEAKGLNKHAVQKSPRTTDPEPSVLSAIRQKLNPNARPHRPAKNYEQPRQLDEHLPAIKERLQEMGMTLIESGPISFGKKMKISAGGMWAEINLFYGQRGFSVVKTSKTGSHAELADMAAIALRDIVDNLPST